MLYFSFKMCRLLVYGNKSSQSLKTLFIRPKKKFESFCNKLQTLCCRLQQVLVQGNCERKVVKKLILLSSSLLFLIFFLVLQWRCQQFPRDSNGGSHKMLCLQTTLEKQAAAAYCTTVRFSSSSAGFQSIVPQSIASNGNKKRTSPRAF